MTTTLVVSDLHLGARTRIDVLRRRDLRERLLAACDGIDRLVLLGDVVEMRHGPEWEALEIARPFFEEVGEALGESHVLIVPGNHDPQLISPWLERRRREGEPPPLVPEQRISPAEASEGARRIAEWLGRAEVEVAYPGAWLRPDVYATHGHYLDRHTTVPAYERIGAAILERFVRPVPERGATPDDYEAVLAPIYALLYTAAQYIPEEAGPGQAGATIRAWRQIEGGGARRQLRYAMLGAALPLVVGGLNRAGIGPLHAELSGHELRRAALEAMAQVLVRLGIEAEHVIFGHTHRAGPMPYDDEDAWVSAAGTRLLNTGNWVYEPAFLTSTPNQSPYWPGTCAVVEDGGAPELRHLLGYRNHADLRPGATPANPA